MNRAVLALALAGALAGCHRKAVPTKSAAGGPGTSVPLPSIQKMEPALPTVQATNSTFLFLNAKGKAQVTVRGEQQTANVNVRVRRDSIVWLSASLLGIEGVRAVLTPDSVRVLNRLERTSFGGGYAYLSRLLNVPVSFEQVQALLLGDYLPAPAGTAPTVASEAGGQRVSYPQAGVLVERLLAANGRVQEVKMSEAATNRRLVVRYQDFQPLTEQNNLPFAYGLNIEAQQAKGSTAAALTYSRVNAGRERLAFPFSVPKGYRVIR